MPLIRLDVSFGEVRLVARARPGLRTFGVPEGGPFDERSAHLANLLLGNPAEAPVLELTMARTSIDADESTLISLHGASCGLSDGPRVSPAVLWLRPGSPLSLDLPTSGCRCYMAVPGGLAASPGGYNAVARPTVGPWAATRLDPMTNESGPIRFIAGPEADWFDLRAFCAGTYAVSPHSNRLGVRLQGPLLPQTRQMASRPLAVGTIQVARGGLPIVIGPDGPTVGGYPRIGVVSRSDLSRLAQMRPGDEVRWLLTDIEQSRLDHQQLRAEVSRRAAQARSSLGWD